MCKPQIHSIQNWDFQLSTFVSPLLIEVVSITRKKSLQTVQALNDYFILCETFV